MKKKKKTVEQQLKQLGVQQVTMTDVMYPDRNKSSYKADKNTLQNDEWRKTK